MLTLPPTPAFIPHRRKRAAQLMLVGANFHVTAGGFVNLTFDRAVYISQLNPLAIQVSDGTFNMMLYQGNVATLLSATLVKLTLTNIGTVPAGNTVLTATANSGIIAVSDGGTWAGVSGVVLPFSG